MHEKEKKMEANTSTVQQYCLLFHYYIIFLMSLTILKFYMSTSPTTLGISPHQGTNTYRDPSVVPSSLLCVHRRSSGSRPQWEMVLTG